MILLTRIRLKTHDYCSEFPEIRTLLMKPMYPFTEAKTTSLATISCQSVISLQIMFLNQLIPSYRQQKQSINTKLNAK